MTSAPIRPRSDTCRPVVLAHALIAALSTDGPLPPLRRRPPAPPGGPPPATFGWRPAFVVLVCALPAGPARPVVIDDAVAHRLLQDREEDGDAVLARRPAAQAKHQTILTRWIGGEIVPVQDRELGGLGRC